MGPVGLMGLWHMRFSLQVVLCMIKSSYETAYVGCSTNIVLAMILYNLFPLLAGPFSRWGEHFSRASQMGFDWVFVNPIQELGASRSLYSIADYFRFNPALLDGTSAMTAEDQ